MKTNPAKQQLTHIIQYRINQKFRSLVIEWFGYESLFPRNQLIESQSKKLINKKEQTIYDFGGYCSVFEVYIPIIHEIKKEDLNPIRYCNPFNIIGFFIVSLLELIPFIFISLARACFKTENVAGISKKSTIKPFKINTIMLWPFVIIFPLCAIGSYVAILLVTGLLRCFFCPANTIIRPSIESFKEQPLIFAINLVAAGLLTWLSMPFILKGLISIGLASSALSLPVIILLYAFVSIAIWVVLLKLKIFLSPHPNKNHQKMALEAELEENSSHTRQVTVMLHGVNPRYTQIKTQEEQENDPWYSLHLFAGTEALWYPAPKSP